MKLTLLLFVASFLIQNNQQHVVGSDAPGTVTLDVRTFDKILARFPVTLVKFDAPFSSGEKYGEYRQLAHDTQNISDLLIAEVEVRGCTTDHNKELLRRFSITKKDIPVLRLFIRGQEESILFKKPIEQFTVEAIKAFIVKHSGLYIGRHYCSEEFDKYAASYMKADKGARKEIYKRAMVDAEKLDGENKKSANIYVDVMKKIFEKGESYIDQEQRRIRKVQSGKISDHNKKQLQGRLNIFKSFNLKDEL